jgi:hypothetical protein
LRYQGDWRIVSYRRTPAFGDVQRRFGDTPRAILEHCEPLIDRLTRPETVIDLLLDD